VSDFLGFMMQIFSKSIIEIIRQRYSCRTYVERPIERDLQLRIAEYAASLGPGPFGGQARFELIAAGEDDWKALRQLGTYGFIKGASGFLVGATSDGEEKLEDFGWQMERLILLATDLGLGTCWLGGTFTKSSFARKISSRPEELIPAVASIGYIARKPRQIDRLIRRGAQGDRRFGWERLFFKEQFGVNLPRQEAGEYALPLEMVRLAPSASNRQPWRVICQGACWHFYLRRTPGYREGMLNRLFTQADLQRIDMGIAMCHFDLTSRELGLAGEWGKHDPGLELPDEFAEYSATWHSR
jgi:nitroreductase